MKAHGNKAIVILICVNFFTQFAFHIITPVVARYAVAIGAGTLIAGMTSTLFTITSLVVRPFGGAILDRCNKKTVLLLSMAATLIAAIGYALAENIGMIFAMRILHGISFGISFTANTALVSEYVPKGKMGEGIGKVTLGQLLANAVGSNAGLTVAECWGYTPVFVIAALSMLVSLILLYLLPYNGTAAAPVSGRIRISSFLCCDVIGLMLISMLFSFASNIQNLFLPLYSVQLNIMGFGSYFTVSALVVIACRVLLGKLYDHKGLVPVVYIGLGVTAISMFIFRQARTMPLFYLAALFFGAGQGLGHPAVQAAAINRVPAHRRGVAVSTLFIGNDLGNCLCSIVNSIVADRFGYSAIFLFSMAIFLAGMVVYSITQAKQRRKPA